MLLAEAAQLEQEIMLLQGAFPPNSVGVDSPITNLKSSSIQQSTLSPMPTLCRLLPPVTLNQCQGLQLNDWLNDGVETESSKESEVRDDDSFLSSSGAADSDDQNVRRDLRSKISEHNVAMHRASSLIQSTARRWFEKKTLERMRAAKIEEDMSKLGPHDIHAWRQEQAQGEEAMGADCDMKSWESDTDDSIDLNLVEEAAAVKRMAQQREVLLKEKEKLAAMGISPLEDDTILELNADSVTSGTVGLGPPCYAAGDRIEVWWEDDEEWFAGVVTAAGETGVDVTYDDGEVEVGVELRLLRPVNSPYEQSTVQFEILLEVDLRQFQAFLLLFNFLNIFFDDILGNGCGRAVQRCTDRPYRGHGTWA